MNIDTPLLEILLLKIGEWHGHVCGKSGAFNLARGCVKVEFKTNPTRIGHIFSEKIF